MGKRRQPLDLDYHGWIMSTGSNWATIQTIRHHCYGRDECHAAWLKKGHALRFGGVCILAAPLLVLDLLEGTSGRISNYTATTLLFSKQPNVSLIHAFGIYWSGLYPSPLASHPKKCRVMVSPSNSTWCAASFSGIPSALMACSPYLTHFSLRRKRRRLHCLPNRQRTCLGVCQEEHSVRRVTVFQHETLG